MDPRTSCFAARAPTSRCPPRRSALRRCSLKGNSLLLWTQPRQQCSRAETKHNGSLKACFLTWQKKKKKLFGVLCLLVLCKHCICFSSTQSQKTNKTHWILSSLCNMCIIISLRNGTFLWITGVPTTAGWACLYSRSCECVSSPRQ